MCGDVKWTVFPGGCRVNCGKSFLTLNVLELCGTRPPAAVPPRESGCPQVQSNPREKWATFTVSFRGFKSVGRCVSFYWFLYLVLLDFLSVATQPSLVPARTLLPSFTEFLGRRVKGPDWIGLSPWITPGFLLTCVVSSDLASLTQMVALISCYLGVPIKQKSIQ